MALLPSINDYMRYMETGELCEVELQMIAIHYPKECDQCHEAIPENEKPIVIHVGTSFHGFHTECYKKFSETVSSDLKLVNVA